jgi:putative SOS response-associated peptidase YedK
MCGRFTLALPWSEVARILRAEAPGPAPAPRWNLAPTQGVTVLVVTGARELRTMRWGLIPSWARDPSIGNRLINARAETLAEKPSFRDSLKNRRCLVVADGFYEWRKEGKEKYPIWIHPRAGGVIAFAGLWDRWTSPDGEVVESCTIVTCAANARIATFHERMPVILPPEAWDAWLAPAPADPTALLPLLVPCPADLLELRRVTTEVNRPSNEGESLIRPADDGP